MPHPQNKTLRLVGQSAKGPKPPMLLGPIRLPTETEKKGFSKQTLIILNQLEKTIKL